MNGQPGETQHQKLEREKREMRQEVAGELAPHEVRVGQQIGHDGAAEVIYGGHTASRPEELSLVRVMRPLPLGGSAEDIGVVHRVHSEDDTITVQFPLDQHRARVPISSVELVQQVDPVYPKVRLRRGERMPTRTQITGREAQLEAERRQLGLPQGAMLPWQAEDHLRVDEHFGRDGKVKIDATYWGIPEPTLDALKNRAIPANEVTGEYGRHFYSNLYERYRSEAHNGEQQTHSVQSSGSISGLTKAPHAGQSGQTFAKVGGENVIARVYVPLEGPELHMNMASGVWQESGYY